MIIFVGRSIFFWQFFPIKIMKIVPKSSNIGQFKQFRKSLLFNMFSNSSPIKSSYKKPDFQTQWQRRQEKHDWFCQSLLSVCLKVKLFVASINWLKAPGNPTEKKIKKIHFIHFDRITTFVPNWSLQAALVRPTPPPNCYISYIRKGKYRPATATPVSRSGLWNWVGWRALVIDWFI